MNNELLLKLIKKEEITEEEIANECYEMCDYIHASCDDSCLIYEKFCGIPREDDENGGCEFFKNGTKIMKELRK
jgi:hypothetical protein